MTRTGHVTGHISPKLLFFFTVIVRRVPFPYTWSSIFVITGCGINQPRIDVEEVNLSFVVASFICMPDAKRAVRD